MAVNTISGFYPGTTVSFSLTILVDSVPPNVTTDTVTWTIKAKNKPDSQALLIASGDVATSGATGIVLFSLTDEQTATLPSGTYVSDVVWRTAAGEEYVVLKQNIVILERVSDP